MSMTIDGILDGIESEAKAHIVTWQSTASVNPAAAVADVDDACFALALLRVVERVRIAGRVSMVVVDHDTGGQGLSASQTMMRDAEIEAWIVVADAISEHE